MMLPESMKSWSKNDYPNSQYQQLQPLRDAIPRAAQVLWAGQSADSVWFLLNRPNYLSVTQTTGMLFSRPMALESARRARAIRQIVPERVFLDWEAADVLWLSVAQQQAICASGAIDYLVTPAELSQTVAVARVQPNSQASSGLKLSAYRCAKN
jgi:hypothetical protein